MLTFMHYTNTVIDNCNGNPGCCKKLFQLLSRNHCFLKFKLIPVLQLVARSPLEMLHFHRSTKAKSCQSQALIATCFFLGGRIISSSYTVLFLTFFSIYQLIYSSLPFLSCCQCCCALGNTCNIPLKETAFQQCLKWIRHETQWSSWMIKQYK